MIIKTLIKTTTKYKLAFQPKIKILELYVLGTVIISSMLYMEQEFLYNYPLGADWTTILFVKTYGIAVMIWILSYFAKITKNEDVQNEK